MQLDVGQRFDRYQVIRALGNGISGESYEALDTLLQRTVALKLIHPWTILPDAIRRQFFRELQNLSLLNHSAITNILDYGDVNGQLYLARKYSSFGSLLSTQGRIWFSPPLPLEQALRYTIQLAHALYYLHTNGFLHGALTLSNLLVQANPLETDTSTTPPLMLSDTETAYFVRRYGHPFLTLLPITAAPEQFSRRTVPASDQYALAAILYYWLAARPPFVGTPEEIEQQKLSGSTIPLSTFNPQVTPTIASIVERALQPSIEDRYPSLLTFTDALHAAYQPLLYEETNPSLPTPIVSKQEMATGPHTPIPAILQHQKPYQLDQADTKLIEAFSTLVAFREQPTQPINQVGIEAASSSPLKTMLHSLLPFTDTQEVSASIIPETASAPIQPEQAPEPTPTPNMPEIQPLPEPTPAPQQPGIQPTPTPEIAPEPTPTPMPEPLPQTIPDVPQPLPEPTPTPQPLPEITPNSAPETPEPTAPDLPLPPAPDIAQPLPDPNAEPLLVAWETPPPPSSLVEVPSLDENVPSTPSEMVLATAEAEPLVRLIPMFTISSPYTEKPYEVLIERDEMTIGRAGSSDILLDYDPFTSRHHALLQRKQKRYFLYDRRSAYGTNVNGQRISSEQSWPLENGDQIAIGQYRLLFSVFTPSQTQILNSQNVEA